MEDQEAGVCGENLDPRIRRTRLALQQALGKLLETAEFDKISVQEVAEAAGVNRATFYDHYTDKFDLLQCMVGTRFGDLLAARGIRFDGGCSSALRGIVTGVCDYLATAPGAECTRQLPHMEAAVIAVVRGMLMHGFAKHPPAEGVSADMVAGTLAWAIYGAAKEWVKAVPRRPVEEAVESVIRLVGPMFAAASAGA
ncbi:MAG TPA: TetR/AcrR family transcriptional regulator [Acidobacteriaceae bacterium]|jgi:AcrR family transcriptional regulator